MLARNWAFNDMSSKKDLYQQNDSFEQKKEKIETELWEGLTKAFHLSCKWKGSWDIFLGCEKALLYVHSRMRSPNCPTEWD